MTTLTVDIEKPEDLAEVKSFLSEKGLAYEVDEDDYEDFVYTDEMKRELDEDEDAYQRGELKLISAEESREEIRNILNGNK